jgi:dephospho-CoA kinase
MILGITGTIGAGKGAVVDYLVQEKGFAHFPVRDFLIEQIKTKGLPENRDSMRSVANEIRKTNSPEYVIKMLYEKAEAHGGDCLIESVRNLKDNGAWLLAVDAGRKLRYERITSRGLSTDHIDFETFIAQEEREFASDDPADMNVIGVMEMADFYIENDGTLEELHGKIQKLLIELS